MAYSLRAAAFELTTTFSRSASGRNFSGIDCHVLRPMITAFRFSGLVVERVSCLKNAMSPRSRHGSAPETPIPRVALQTATTSLTFIFSRGVAGVFGARGARTSYTSTYMCTVLEYL